MRLPLQLNGVILDVAATVSMEKRDISLGRLPAKLQLLNAMLYDSVKTGVDSGGSYQWPGLDIRWPHDPILERVSKRYSYLLRDEHMVTSLELDEGRRILLATADDLERLVRLLTQEPYQYEEAVRDELGMAMYQTVGQDLLEREGGEENPYERLYRRSELANRRALYDRITSEGPPPEKPPLWEGDLAYATHYGKRTAYYLYVAILLQPWTFEKLISQFLENVSALSVTLFDWRTYVAQRLPNSAITMRIYVTPPPGKNWENWREDVLAYAVTEKGATPHHSDTEYGALPPLLEENVQCLFDPEFISLILFDEEHDAILGYVTGALRHTPEEPTPEEEANLEQSRAAQRELGIEEEPSVVQKGLNAFCITDLHITLSTGKARARLIGEKLLHYLFSFLTNTRTELRVHRVYAATVPCLFSHLLFLDYGFYSFLSRESVTWFLSLVQSRLRVLNGATSPANRWKEYGGDESALTRLYLQYFLPLVPDPETRAYLQGILHAMMTRSEALLANNLYWESKIGLVLRNERKIDQLIGQFTRDGAAKYPLNGLTVEYDDLVVEVERVRDETAVGGMGEEHFQVGQCSVVRGRSLWIPWNWTYTSTMASVAALIFEESDKKRERKLVVKKTLPTKRAKQQGKKTKTKRPLKSALKTE